MAEHSANTGVSLPKRLANFTNSTAGLEKTLRLIQALAQFHDMNVWLVPWYTTVLIEANKFWFYSICISITRSLLESLLGFAIRPRTPKGRGQQKKKKEDKSTSSAPGSSTTTLLERIVIDSCDLALPGSFLGWTALGDLEVGMAMIVSTVVASRDIWSKSQQ
ncbi:uncharacterized protein ATNIH1004_011392 [Aspergillus tanneri]|uniref:Uncharacterized protein n=1 Tax=Aspergillus tanneri TaxID=1220188 RepID=A0A5M9M6L9_9EURO|nr:uncharacterized protein ATNIH1004_011392 [Aspergillus tanneri]KAA8642448.1 hypothetical protein ATNIH1004_011392 [Aspergillus tanneri]